MKVLHAILAAALVGSLAAAGWLIARGAPELPRHGAVPQFRLTERSGRPVGLDDLRGKVWVADFIFTRCQGPCPLMTGRMISLARELAGEEDLRFVSVSADPDYDTPEVLARYAAAYRIEDPRWLFLTGAREETKRLSEGLLLPLLTPEPGETRGEILHSDRFVLIDRSGAVRGYYDAADPEQAKRLRRDVRRLLRERVAA